MGLSPDHVSVSPCWDPSGRENEQSEFALQLRVWEFQEVSQKLSFIFCCPGGVDGTISGDLQGMS